MPGTKEGARKMVQTTRERYGVTEDGKSLHHTQAGAIGGKNGHEKGFWVMAQENPEKHKEVSSKGGVTSRRGPKV